MTTSLESHGDREADSRQPKKAGLHELKAAAGKLAMPELRKLP